MALPAISTAIPKHRYQLNEFQLVLLGDIDSRDENDYLYLLAVIRDGKDQPELYISAEKIKTGSCRVRVMAEQAEQIIGEAEICDLETFSLNAILTVKKLLGMMGEEAMQTM